MEDKTKMEEEKIVLTLEKPEENNTVETTEKVEEEKPVKTELDMSVFSDEELKMIDDFSEKIDISDTNIIMSYGSTAQNKISDFSGRKAESRRHTFLEECISWPERSRHTFQMSGSLSFLLQLIFLLLLEKSFYMDWYCSFF